MTTILLRFTADQRGATAIEYALIGSLISVAILGAVMLVGNSLENTYGTIRDDVVAATAPAPEE